MFSPGSSFVHTQDRFSFVAELIVNVDPLAKLGQIKCPHFYFSSYHSGPGMSHKSQITFLLALHSTGKYLNLTQGHNQSVLLQSVWDCYFFFLVVNFFFLNVLTVFVLEIFGV